MQTPLDKKIIHEEPNRLCKDENIYDIIIYHQNFNLHNVYKMLDYDIQKCPDAPIKNQKKSYFNKPSTKGKNLFS